MTNVKLKNSNETPAMENSYGGSHSGACSHRCSVWRTFFNGVQVRTRQYSPAIAKLLSAVCNLLLALALVPE